MAFDLGWNFRSTSGYVTDQSFCVPCLGEAYPHTYTAANGFSMSAGYTVGPDGVQDRVNTNDPRIAGRAFHENVTPMKIFRIDLDSGSAPGAGAYLTDLAMGDPAGSTPATSNLKVLDNTTVLIDLSAGFGTASGHYHDATTADVAATTSWTGTQASKTFATTTCFINLGGYKSTGGEYTSLAHFRLTLVPPAAPTLGASLLLLGIPFIRAGLGIAYSLAVDPLVLHLNGGAVGLQYTAGQKAYTLAVDPMTLHLNLADVGLQFTGGPKVYSLAVDPLTLHLNGEDVGLAFTPFTPPAPAPPFTPSKNTYLEYRRHRRMGR